jgi:hypothetical protein
VCADEDVDLLAPKPSEAEIVAAADLLSNLKQQVRGGASGVRAETAGADTVALTMMAHLSAASVNHCLCLCVPACAAREPAGPPLPAVAQAPRAVPPRVGPAHEDRLPKQQICPSNGAVRRARVRVGADEHLLRCCARCLPVGHWSVTNGLDGSDDCRFACLYTSHVSNLIFYSPLKSWRGKPDAMTHEMELNS